MNADRLLANYERIADAPDTVPRLRRFILELAVRGKLVEQDPEDEPASELLKRIAAEKARLVKAGTTKLRKIKAREREEPIDLSIPPGWELTELGVIAEKITDGAHKTPTYVEEGVPFVSVKDFSGGILDLSNTRSIPSVEHKVLYQRCDPRRGDILIGRIGTLGKAVLVDTDIEFSVFVSVGLIRFDHQCVNPEYLRFVINSPFVETEFDRIKIGGGTHTNKLNLGDIHTVAFPLPPLPEQHRIVAKVDELMALCDQLQSARTEREATRDRLAAASLARLNAPDPDPAAFRDHAAYALNNLATLTTRRDQVKALRQTVLNLAVRGKLVAQDRTESRDNQGHIRADALAEKFDAQAFADRAALFSKPVNWTVEALSRVASHIVDCPHTTPKWTDEGVLCIKTNQVRAGRLDLSSPYFVSEEAYKSRISRLEPKPGDVLYIREGGILGVACRVPRHTRLCLGQRLMLIRVNDTVTPRFLEICLNSPWITEFAVEKTTGGAAPRVNMSTVRGYPIPVPPLSEQYQIVAKVDELMALCDQLEANLASCEDTRRRLLDAFLYEAFEPTTGCMATA